MVPVVPQLVHYVQMVCAQEKERGKVIDLATTCLSIGISSGSILGPTIAEYITGRAGCRLACAWGGTYMLTMAALFWLVSRDKKE